MKFIAATFLSLVAVVSASENASSLLGGLDEERQLGESVVVTKYQANLGPYGKFKLIIKEKGNLRTMKYTSNLKNLDDIARNEDFLNYHLHTFWGNEDDYSTTSCGPTVTGGHYDPFKGCGGASAQTDAACIEALRLKDDYGNRCSDFGDMIYDEEGVLKCEVGDLSGKYGSIHVNHEGKAFESVINDPLPARNGDYDPDGEINDPSKFASIVFHDGSPRVLCGKLELLD